MAAPDPPLERDPRVDVAIEGFPDWQAALARRVRQLVHEADPDVRETVRYGNRPYFHVRGALCALQATKDHLNVFLYDGGLAPDPEGIINRGHEAVTGRQIALYEGDPLRDDALRDILRSIASTNRAGGWRRVTRG